MKDAFRHYITIIPLMKAKKICTFIFKKSCEHSLGCLFIQFSTCCSHLIMPKLNFFRKAQHCKLVQMIQKILEQLFDYMFYFFTIFLNLQKNQTTYCVLSYQGIEIVEDDTKEFLVLFYQFFELILSKQADLACIMLPRHGNRMVEEEAKKLLEKLMKSFHFSLFLQKSTSKHSRPTVYYSIQAQKQKFEEENMEFLIILASIFYFFSFFLNFQLPNLPT